MAAAVKQFLMLDGLMGGLSRYNRVYIQGETTSPLKHVMWGVFVLGTGLEVTSIAKLESAHAQVV